ncbi:hypothetical protein B0J11DRAFT_509936 [Dendryphion nanum]|uniref:Uncharacterized protein n=1 Tax=Dendryphion nanum TaxID=256645 RepID=A0A9P9IEY5_9PLEO|nr:hypothetical protein B0J11DRAFT_509936 [Dendryphion nanum]
MNANYAAQICASYAPPPGCYRWPPLTSFPCRTCGQILLFDTFKGLDGLDYFSPQTAHCPRKTPLLTCEQRAVLTCAQTKVARELQESCRLVTKGLQDLLARWGTTMQTCLNRANMGQVRDGAREPMLRNVCDTQDEARICEEALKRALASCQKKLWEVEEEDLVVPEEEEEEDLVVPEEEEEEDLVVPEEEEEEEDSPEDSDSDSDATIVPEEQKTKRKQERKMVKKEEMKKKADEEIGAWLWTGQNAFKNKEIGRKKTLKKAGDTKKRLVAVKDDVYADIGKWEVSYFARFKYRVETLEDFLKPHDFTSRKPHPLPILDVGQDVVFF